MPGQRIGKFELLDELGKGGMGVVYRARDVRLDRLVALKLMQHDRALDGASRARFLRECRAVAALNHPNIATLYEADETGDGTLYFAAELVTGRTLSDLMADGLVPMDRVVAYGLQLAEALAAAHSKGIVHRDIKPSNLMVTDEGRLKVLDFGLARLTPRDVPEPDAPTQTIAPSGLAHSKTMGTIVGTPGYMAPEQIRAEPVGSPADVFAAGVVLYELATGARAFPGMSLDEKLQQVLSSEPPSASSVNRRVPGKLAAVITRALEKDPARRIQNGAALLEALSRSMRARARPRWQTWSAAALGFSMGTLVWWSQRDTLAFAKEDRVLIADVANETSESVLGGALGTALEVDLRQSTYALVVGRKEIAEALQLTRRPPDTALDVETALDLARWVGAKAVLAPTIVQAGNTFRLEAALYATETRNPVDRVSVLAEGRDAVLSEAVDDLTAEVRKRLGESLGQIEQDDAPVVKLTTASWDALEAVSLGLKATDVGRYAEAAEFFQEAINLDPEFAGAKGSLGLVLIQFLDQPDRGRALLSEAALSADRLSNYERVMLDGLIKQHVDGDLDAALEQFRMAAGLFPARSEPHQNIGIILRSRGLFAEAGRAFAEAIARAPRSAQPRVLLWFLQVGPLRDPVGAEALARQLMDLRPDDADFRHVLAWSLLAQLRFEDAARELASILETTPDHARSRINLAHLTLRLGDAPAAVVRYRSIADDSRAGRIQQDAMTAVFWLAVALRQAGLPDEASPLFAEVATAARLPAFRALVDAARGETDMARRALDVLPPVDEMDYRTAHSAAAAWGFLGDRDRALAALARAFQVNAWDVYYNLILPDFQPLWGDDRFTALVTGTQVRGPLSRPR